MSGKQNATDERYQGEVSADVCSAELGKDGSNFFFQAEDGIRDISV